MQVAQTVVELTCVCMVSTLFLVVSVSVQANLPKATMDDYVWEVIEAPIYPNLGKTCNSKNELKYRDCLDQSTMIYNQNISAHFYYYKSHPS